jgi:hypothetical protein
VPTFCSMASSWPSLTGLSSSSTLTSVSVKSERFYPTPGHTMPLLGCLVSLHRSSRSHNSTFHLSDFFSGALALSFPAHPKPLWFLSVSLIVSAIVLVWTLQFCFLYWDSVSLVALVLFPHFLQVLLKCFSLERLLTLSQTATSPYSVLISVLVV